MFIPGLNLHPSSEASQQSEFLQVYTKEEAVTKPTVLFSNPNACFYEYLDYQTEWVDFYTRHGVNMVVWNYRSYGRTSPKSLTPLNIMKDGEKVLQHVKSNLGLEGKIAVHGESLGGCVSSYIGMKCQVDFVFSNRTFTSLNQVVYWNFGGSIMEKLFSVFTRWTVDDADHFNNISAYKLFGSDPNDNIITELSSLRNGIGRIFMNGSQSIISDNAFLELKEAMQSLNIYYDDFAYRNVLCTKQTPTIFTKPGKTTP